MTLNIDEVVEFLTTLAANNNKAWFDAQRTQFQLLRRQFSDFVQEIIFAISEFDEAVQGVRAKETIFRIHRDVRFSKDKTPYKTTFSAAINPQGRGMDAPGYYFHIGAGGEELFAACGIYAPQPERLAMIRRFIAAQPDRLTRLLEDRSFRTSFPTIGSDPLKRPPKGYDETTPHIETIKLRHFVVWRESVLAPATDDDAVRQEVLAVFQAGYPWIVWLRDAVRI